MADDPNRDFLPVKEGSNADTFRSSIDPRERHSVYKLDRYVLEDKYLRLLDEVNSLKKLSNCQEDKIKRLATKLMRVIANPRPSTTNSNAFDDKSRCLSLELENIKLKDKIAVLRNQLLSHTIRSRTSSRTRNSQTRPSSARTTSQSDTSRTKIPSCHCLERTVNDNDVDGAQNKIEELEIQKKEMANRIEELENELLSRDVTNQREKVAENVESIKRWRQMKKINDKLLAVENTNESLNAQSDDLRRMLEETTKNNEVTTAALENERRRSSELEGEILKSKSFELTLREKDEQIRDLSNEIKILQQHNSELISLSSKNGNVELENAELKRKINEQREDQESLRSAYNNEQANIMALKASNNQLLAKLQELQTTIDSLTVQLTVQLTSFQSQAKRQETPTAMQIPTEQGDKMIPSVTNREPHEISGNEIPMPNKYYGLDENVTQFEENTNVGAKHSSIQPINKQVQTEYVDQAIVPDKMDQGMTPVKGKIGGQERTSGNEISERGMVPESPLTPEKMLKLLEQAQITVPMDSSRFSHKDIVSNVNYNDILERNQRHSDAETLAQGIPAFQPQPNHPKYDKYACPTKCQLPDTDKMLSVLFNVFQELSLSAKVLDEATSLYRPMRNDQLDGNKNIDVTGTRKRGPSRGQQGPIHHYRMDVMNGKSRSYGGTRSGCSSKKFCSSGCGRQSQDKLRRKAIFCSAKSNIEVSKLMENGDCTCSSTLGCNVFSDCDRRCCNGGPVKIPGECTTNNNNQYDLPPIVMKNGTESVPPIRISTANPTAQSSGQNGADATRAIRKLQDEDRKGSNRMGDTNIMFSGVENEELDDAATLQEYITELNRCKQLVDKNTSFDGPCGIPVKAISKVLDPLRCCEISTAESQCSTNCPGECVDSASSVSDTFPMVIPDGQGLMELHISSLQLSTSAKQILFRETDMHNVPVFICWDIWDQETVCTPTLKCSELNFNFSIVYRIPDLFCFFNYVFSELVVFQVIVQCDDDASYSVASGKLSIKDILDYPQNKLHYVAPMYSVFPCSLGSNFGQLSLWVRLSCDLEQVVAFKRKLNLPAQSDMEPRRLSGTSALSSSIKTTIGAGSPMFRSSKDGFTYDDTKKALFQNTSFMSANGSYHPEVAEVIKPPTEDPTIRIKETESRFHVTTVPYHTEQQQEFSNGKENLPTDQDDVDFPNDIILTDGEDRPPLSTSRMEFNAILKTGAHKHSRGYRDDSDDSIGEVNNVLLEKNWQQYRKRSSIAYDKLKQYEKPESDGGSGNDNLGNDFVERDTIIIEIVNIVLFPKCSVMENPDVQLLYVEYCFLGHCGADMETISVKKPTPPNHKLAYNFRKKFRVDSERHLMQDSILRAMLNETSNPKIKFIVVCEPVPEETESKECIEVGYSYFNVREYALGKGDKVSSIPIYTPDESEQIGLLKILVLGVDTIRQRMGTIESDD